ncbi:MAG: DUF4270 domain-containing protein [Prevotella sp.]|nr:DUF4270 domain-containing protein [Prevotella sp.]
MKAKTLAAAMLFAVCIASCDDTTDTIGTSLTDNMDHLQITTDTFNVSSRSIVADSVFSRSTIGYLGTIKDPETGARISSDFMVQFNTFEDYRFPATDSIVSVQDGEIIADSCEIQLFYSSFFGDSLTTMQATAYEMATPMQEGVRYYSNYDPMANGLIREGGICKKKTYTLSDQSVKDSLRATSNYSPSIRISLNEPYTDKDGKTYNNFGTYIMRKYYENPNYFKNSYNFIHNVCPGFYVKTTGGLGCMAYIDISWISVYFRVKSGDNVSVGVARFSGTEEVLQATHITNDQKKIKQLAEDPTCTYLKSPAGIFTEVELPVNDITLNHANDTLNSAKLKFSRINNNVHGSNTLSVPSSLLMVERDSMYTFFEKGKNIDNKQTFVTSYSANAYSFSNISGLIRHMAEARANGLKSNSNWEAEHPNWNKVVLIPVKLTSTNGSIVRVTHDMSLSSTRLVGGTQNPYDALKMSIIYSKFSNK